MDSIDSGTQGYILTLYFLVCCDHTLFEKGFKLLSVGVFDSITARGCGMVVLSV